MAEAAVTGATHSFLCKHLPKENSVVALVIKVRDVFPKNKQDCGWINACINITESDPTPCPPPKSMNIQEKQRKG